MDSELPAYADVYHNCDIQAHEGGVAAVFKCRDDDNWLGLREGYYVLDMESESTLTHARDFAVALGFVGGYDAAHGAGQYA